MESIAKRIDHTLLKPQASREQLVALCHEAVTYGFRSVCVNPCRVREAAKLLRGSSTLVCTVIGFPLGAATIRMKAAEALEAVESGAGEVDMVMNIGAAKDGDWNYVQEDIGAVVQAVAGRAVVKVIIETCLLTETEKRRACSAILAAGGDFVKTSTGFAGGGATVEDVRLLRECVGDKLQVKASGGIGSYEGARAMLEAGADRLGTSAGVAIMNGAAGSNAY
ncbi:deoxyribose-phosphate aldolase [Acetonema longum DSM 6540]|uniref:Deoxyribose-phosphate aldolase n=1 Tax=Acetonema longum DSM 6540 TaxID=1009370 RepID=F7NJW4_9FIRM|nr:deoxyribose-phosphate aldolase [Acetonema longum DSM 6540]